jgi:hypothetical protein
MKKLTISILISALGCLLGACGSGSSSPSAGSGTTPPPSTVTGIATPATISVVTAQ